MTEPALTAEQRFSDAWMSCLHESGGICSKCIIAAIRSASEEGERKGFREGQERMQKRAMQLNDCGFCDGCSCIWNGIAALPLEEKS